MFVTFVIFTVLALIAGIVAFCLHRAGYSKPPKETLDSYGNRRSRDEGAVAAHGAFKVIRIITLGLAVIAALFLVLASVRTVKLGEVGVLTFFGAVEQRPLQPGLHLWINPLKRQTNFSTRTEVYTASSGQRGNFDADAQVHQDTAIGVQSKDGLRVNVDVAVWFHVVSFDAPRLYARVGVDYIDKIVRAYTRAAVRDATTKYDATQLYQEGRTKLAQDIENIILTEFAKRGLVCENVALRDIELPPVVANAIQAKLEAQQAAQKMEFTLQKETQEAERKRIEARGIKDSQDIIQTTLTGEYLQYYYIEALKQLVDSPNNTILVLPFDQKLTPLLNVTSAQHTLPPPPKP